LRWIVRTGAPWRWMPHDLPPWNVVYQQSGALDRVSELAKRLQDETGETVDIAYVDQGYTGETAADAAGEHGIKLEVVKLPTAKRGFVLLPRRWVVLVTKARRFTTCPAVPDTLRCLERTE